MMTAPGGCPYLRQLNQNPTLNGIVYKLQYEYISCIMNYIFNLLSTYTESSLYIRQINDRLIVITVPYETKYYSPYITKIKLIKSNPLGIFTQIIIYFFCSHG